MDIPPPPGIDILPPSVQKWLALLWLYTVAVLAVEAAIERRLKGLEDELNAALAEALKTPGEEDDAAAKAALEAVRVVNSKIARVRPWLAVARALLLRGTP